MTSVFLFSGILLFMYGVRNIVLLQKEFIEKDKIKRRKIFPSINISKIIWSSKTNICAQSIHYRSTYCTSAAAFL